MNNIGKTILGLLIVAFLIVALPTGSAHLIGLGVALIVFPFCLVYKIIQFFCKAINYVFSSPKDTPIEDAATYDYKDVRNDVRRFHY